MKNKPKSYQELQIEYNILEADVKRLNIQLGYYKFHYHEVIKKIADLEKTIVEINNKVLSDKEINQGINLIRSYITEKDDHQISTGHILQTSEQQKNMLLIRFLTSKAVYKMDIQNFGFPCERTMYRYRQLIIQEHINVEDIVGANFTSCVRRLQNYRKYHNLISKTPIPVIIATDGCYFNKKMKKDENGDLTNVIEVTFDDKSVENYAINSGIAYLMVPLCVDLPPLLLFFQLHETGHASDDTWETLKKMKDQLSKNHFICEGFAKDSDKYWAQHTTSAFEQISKNFYEKEKIDVYSLLSGVQHYLDIQDLLHLLKRIHYRHIKKPIKLQFKLDGLEYDFKESIYEYTG
ncbi:Conserved_hypothetical protein [Hexamita inflata]|uniref:Uncharacterized protein n=1 Tax=Hexamita inflata TaxID=28002 RepID=A0AA86U4M2_9EUKA|nr:Conserved hypothetical protein [Hexamita inflata]